MTVLGDSFRYVSDANILNLDANNHHWFEVPSSHIMYNWTLFGITTLNWRSKRIDSHEFACKSSFSIKSLWLRTLPYPYPPLPKSFASARIRAGALTNIPNWATDDPIRPLLLTGSFELVKKTQVGSPQRETPQRGPLLLVMRVLQPFP